MGHAQQVRWSPGTAGGSFAGQRVRQPNIGPGRPRECGRQPAGGRGWVDLAGDVALEPLKSSPQPVRGWRAAWWAAGS